MYSINTNLNPLIFFLRAVTDYQIIFYIREYLCETTYFHFFFTHIYRILSQIQYQ